MLGLIITLIVVGLIAGAIARLLVPGRQDIGIAAMFILKKDDYLSVLDEKAVSGLPVTNIETQIFGFDHSEFGAELLETWGLPESVVTPIRYHHRTESAPLKVRATSRKVGVLNAPRSRSLPVTAKRPWSMRRLSRHATPVL